MEQMLDMFEEASSTTGSFDPEIEIHGQKETVKEKTEKAIAIQLSHLRKGNILAASISGGKDSTVVASIALVAYKLYVKEVGRTLAKPPVMHIITSDTGMENIIKQDYLNRFFESCEVYGLRKGFDVICHKAGPSRSESYLRIYAGGKEDPRVKYTSKKKECAQAWKVNPIQRALRNIKKGVETDGYELIMLVGSRDEESTTRAESLKKYNASHENPIDVNGYQTLYPIKNWLLEDVWEYLTFAEDDDNAFIQGSQDGFPETAELYAGYNGGACVTTSQHSDSMCGARDGCSSCMIVEHDKSAINQANHSDYKHISRTLKDVLALRNWRKDFGNDYQNRNFISMVDDDGYINFRPNGYCGWFLEENLRITLTIQERDKERAEDLVRAIIKIEEKIENGTIANERRAKKWLRKVTPHCKQLFKIIDEKDILWLDFQWSLRGLTRKVFSASRIWDEVVNKGQWAEIPGEDYCRPSTVTDKRFVSSKSMPPLAKIYHGIKPDITVKSETHTEHVATNFSDLTHDFFDHGHGIASTDYTINAKGDTIEAPTMNIDDCYDVDGEAANFICDEPHEFLLTKQVDWWPDDFKHQNAIKKLLQLGAIQVNKRQLRYINEKMDLLYFTATEGLQDLAYVGGPLSIDDNPKIEYGDSDGTLQLF